VDDLGGDLNLQDIGVAGLSLLKRDSSPEWVTQSAEPDRTGLR
jgi:hypothetical protein